MRSPTSNNRRKYLYIALTSWRFPAISSPRSAFFFCASISSIVLPGFSVLPASPGKSGPYRRARKRVFPAIGPPGRTWRTTLAFLRWSALAFRGGPPARCLEDRPSERSASAEVFPHLFQLLLLVGIESLVELGVDFLLKVVELLLLFGGQLERVRVDFEMIWPGKGNAAKPPGPNGLISRTCFFWASLSVLSSLPPSSFWKSSICLLCRATGRAGRARIWARDRRRPEDRLDRPDRPDSP